MLKGNKTLTQEQTNKILYPLLSALEEIHNANLVHRDIKPSNIYLKEDGSPVLLDFGAARSELMGHSRSITSLATPGYGAYEQYTTRGKQYPWTDIYGLGATLYKATCGRKAPDAPDRMLEDALEPPGIILGKFFDKKFSDMLAACLKVRAKDRPQSIQEVREILQENVISETKNRKKIIEKEPSVKKKKEIKSSSWWRPRSESPASPNYGLIGFGSFIWSRCSNFSLEISETMKTVKLFNL